METPSWPNIAFGEQLRLLRKAAGLTQEELASRVGLDRTYISLLERGVKSPTLNTFFRLCKALDQAPTKVIAMVVERMDLEEQQITFKGLEKAVVILAELEKIVHSATAEREQLIYVALSRAKQHLILLGNLPAQEG